MTSCGPATERQAAKCIAYFVYHTFQPLEVLATKATPVAARAVLASGNAMMTT